MTPRFSSQWINAWLNVLSTTILAGKEDLFDFANTLYWGSSWQQRRCSFTQYYQYIPLQSQPILWTRNKGRLVCFLVLPWAIKAVLVTLLSHQITWQAMQPPKCKFFSIFSLGPFHVSFFLLFFLQKSTGYFPSCWGMLHFSCNMLDIVWWQHVMLKLFLK